MRTQATKIRWFYLCLGTLGMLVAGIIYAWSILKGPLATEFGWDAAQLGFNYTLTMLFVGAGNLLAGVLYHKVPYRLLFLASAVMVFGAFFGSAMMSGKHIVQLYICYAGIGGIGIGLFVVLIMSAVGSWFPDRKGLSAGTMNMGFGFSSMLFGTLASVLFEIPGFGWRNTYIALAAIGGIILLLVALLIKVAPADAQLPAAKVSKNAMQEEILNVSTPQMFRRLGFWQYYIFSILVFSLGSALISFAADYFKSIGAATALAVALVSVISVSNGVGRLCFGVIFDKKGRRTAMQTAAFAAVIAAALLALSIPTGQIILAVAGSVLAGFSYGGISSLASAVSRLYGNQHFASNYSIMLTFSMVASLMATVAGKILAVSGSYLTVFCIFLPICGLALLIAFWMKRM